MLSEENIRLFDVGYNIMFDGENMLGVDTCGFTKNEPNILERNIRTYNYAIEGLFSLWFGEDDPVDYEIEGTDIDSYLKKIISRVPEDIKKQNPKQFKL